MSEIENPLAGWAAGFVAGPPVCPECGREVLDERCAVEDEEGVLVHATCWSRWTRRPAPPFACAPGDVDESGGVRDA